MKAVFEKSLQSLRGDKHSAGGSTLATQIEKYRHSPEGRTSTPKEKLRQMISASLRAYKHGENTTEVRRKIVLDYLNTVPLSAKPGYGEVNGIGDGLWVWYQRPFTDVNRLLKANINDVQTVGTYKEALSLMIAQRRPSYYLGAGKEDLEVLTNSHLRVLQQAGIITPALRDAALKYKLQPSKANTPAPQNGNGFVERKATNAIRTHLSQLLGTQRLYSSID